jgi:hypothetical protein
MIYDFEFFLREGPQLKESIIADFRDQILPFWEEEVIHVVVEGEPKSFNVYLVD